MLHESPQHLMDLLRDAISYGWSVETSGINSPIEDLIEIALDIMLLIKSEAERLGPGRLLNKEVLFSECEQNELGNPKQISFQERENALASPTFVNNLTIIIEYLINSKRLGKSATFHKLQELDLEMKLSNVLGIKLERKLKILSKLYKFVLSSKGSQTYDRLDSLLRTANQKKSLSIQTEKVSEKQSSSRNSFYYNRRLSQRRPTN